MNGDCESRIEQERLWICRAVDPTVHPFLGGWSQRVPPPCRETSTIPQPAFLSQITNHDHHGEADGDFGIFSLSAFNVASNGFPPSPYNVQPLLARSESQHHPSHCPSRAQQLRQIAERLSKGPGDSLSALKQRPPSPKLGQNRPSVPFCLSIFELGGPWSVNSLELAHSTLASPLSSLHSSQPPNHDAHSPFTLARPSIPLPSPAGTVRLVLLSSARARDFVPFFRWLPPSSRPFLMPIATSPSVPRPATFAKMEDRKRPASTAVDDNAPPSKRQAVNGASKPKDDADKDKEELWIEVSPDCRASPLPRPAFCPRHICISPLTRCLLIERVPQPGREWSPPRNARCRPASFGQHQQLFLQGCLP